MNVIDEIAEWDVDACDSTECDYEVTTGFAECEIWEPADNSVTAILILAALAWYPLVRWVLVPIANYFWGDW